MKSFFLLCFAFLTSMAHGLTQGEMEAAREVIARYAGSAIANALMFESLDKVDGCDVFEIAENGRLLRGSSAVALCKAFYTNVKQKGAGIVSWSGSRLDETRLFEPSEPLRVVAPYRFYQYFNVVTFGYSLPYWSEERWMQEIDWMALHGINMPLALIANEAICERVWQRLGLTSQEIEATFVGPAHLPWMRMGNLCGRPDSPQPKAWRERSIRLQHAVLKRMRSLGMTPIVQGFAGFVPPALTRLYPEARLLKMEWSEGAFHSWFLSPDQALFRTIGRLYIEEWEREFGVCDYTLADSFNEMELPWQTPEAREEGLATCGANVFGAIHDANPKATWVLQGWMLGYQRHIWNTETLGALLRDVPKDQVLILDMAVDYNTHFWKNGENAEVFKGFLGRPWIWSTIPNMGGKSAQTGILEFYANGHLRSLSSPDRGHLVGYGMAPEGIENNEVLYELLTDAGWSREPIDLRRWLMHYSLCRYGSSPAPLEAYWEGMLQSVYGHFTDHPRFCWQTTPGRRSGTVHFNEAYIKGCQEFAQCAPLLHTSALYQADLREVVAFTTGAHLEMVLRALQTVDPADHSKQEQLRTIAIELFQTIDQLLVDHPTLNLSRWLSFARHCAEGDEALADYYETNARRIITVWGPPVNDYSARIWSGRVGSYYLQRYLLHWKARDEQAATKIAEFERRWVEERLPLLTFPSINVDAPEEILLKRLPAVLELLQGCE